MVFSTFKMGKRKNKIKQNTIQALHNRGGDGHEETKGRPAVCGMLHLWFLDQAYVPLWPYTYTTELVITLCAAQKKKKKKESREILQTHNLKIGLNMMCTCNTEQA